MTSPDDKISALEENKISALEEKISAMETLLDQAIKEGNDSRMELFGGLLKSYNERITELQKEKLLLQQQSTGLNGGGEIENINHRPIRVLGDKCSGPHSTAIIIGRRTVVSCAHSLDFVPDEQSNVRSTRSAVRLKYLEEYWIQPRFTKNSKGEYTTDGRIPITLYKFNADNDWALFTRSDGLEFAESEIAVIDKSPNNRPYGMTGFYLKSATVLHCPVSLATGINKPDEYSIGCNIAKVNIQVESSHHIKYEGGDLCRGSSGGGVYVSPTCVLGMHVEAINEAEYDADDDNNAKNIIASTDKRVDSEEKPYGEFDSDAEIPEKKKLKVVSESVASIAGGNNGLGSALILCKCARLMYYLEQNEK